MPLGAGTAAKVGIRYEDRWCAYCALRVLAGDASAIYIERPGPAHEGFEFSLEASGGTEYHQAKSQKTGEGRWTIGALSEAGVLKAFFDRLHSTDSNCLFVSGHAAYQLEELADRARKAESFAQFKKDYLSSETWRGHFRQLVAATETAEEWTWGALRRIQAKTIGEQALSESVAFRTEWLLDGAKDSASAALIEVLRDAVNERLTAQELWRRLKNKGYQPNPLASPKSAAVRLEAANERFRHSREGGRIAGRLISRTETARLKEAMRKERVVLLEGAAGMGKSEVISELIEGFEKESIPYLAMRLDRRPAATFTAEELGAKLGLPASPPVTLAAAAGSPSYLIVDQLDAISTTSGRDPEFFDCVEEMLRLALAEPQTRIVLACRSFDAANDPRLRRLIDEQSEDSRVSVGPLPEKQVQEALAELGVEVKAFRDDLIELLTVPLHLALMGQISARSAEDVAPLKTLSDLYGAFWDDKHREVRELLGREPRWTEVLDAVVDRMSEEPALKVPRETVDAWKSDVDAMLSSAVLFEDDGQLAFFHETFFDYAFARRFSSRKLALEDLLAHDQLLFRRAQVRQILAHARDGSLIAYEKDLRFLLDDASVRFHLKDLVLAWLGTVSDPRPVEWDLVERLLDGESEPIAERARITLCSPQWFRFLYGRGVLTDWLAAGGEWRERAQLIISAAGPESGDRVATLLAPYEGDAENQGFDIEAVLLRSNLAESRDLFELLIKEIESSPELSRRDFWFLAHELPEQRPEWACELLGAYLATRLATGELVSVGSGPFAGTRLTPEGLHLREYVTAAASGAPAAFLEHVWPVMLQVIEQTAGPARDDRPRHDRIWNLRHFSDGPGDLDDDLLAGAEIAVEGLASAEPARFEALFEEHAETPYETVAFLLFRGLSANPETFADRAIAFLLADCRRFRVSHSDGDHWASRKLLEAITPAASRTVMGQLEAALLDYYTQWERSVDGYKQFGLAQFELLGGVAKEARTPAMAKRFAELQRKFGREDAWKPHGIRAGVVGPPIPEDAARKMNDANWVRAMMRYASEDHRSERDFLKGSARELAGVLETLCSEDPTRFARLGVTLPDEINSTYFDALLRGVGNSGERPALADTEALIVRCHRLPDRPCGRWIGHPLRVHVEEEISEQMLRILSWYATEGEGPSSTDFGERSEEEQLLTQGLNSVRGGIADELGRLIYANPAFITPLEGTLRRLCKDKAVAVRAMAAGAVLGVLAHDQDLGLELFLELIEGTDDTLLATRYVRQFLVHRGAHEFDALEPVIRRMVASPVAAVRTDGAAQVALASLSVEDARLLAEECVDGTPELRLGAVKAFADNLQNARFRSRCEECLIVLFADEDEEVRKTAAGAVSRLKPNEVGDASGMIEAFLTTPAFEEDPETVLRALEGTTSAGVKLSLDACERTVDILESTPEARQLHHGISDASEVAVRAYTDAADEAEKNRALDVIDRALALNAYGARRALQEHDRG